MRKKALAHDKSLQSLNRANLFFFVWWICNLFFCFKPEMNICKCICHVIFQTGQHIKLSKFRTIFVTWILGLYQMRIFFSISISCWLHSVNSELNKMMPMNAVLICFCRSFNYDTNKIFLWIYELRYLFFCHLPRFC